MTPIRARVSTILHGACSVWHTKNRGSQAVDDRRSGVCRTGHQRRAKRAPTKVAGWCGIPCGVMTSGWPQSPKFREIARRSGRKNAWRWWHEMPRCSATAKSTGERCRRVAFAACGKCPTHGGLTPANDDWHMPRWPRPGGKKANLRLARKVNRLAKAATKRQRRIDGMAPEERAAWDLWHRSYQPWSKSTAGRRAAGAAAACRDPEAARAFRRAARVVAGNPGA